MQRPVASFGVNEDHRTTQLGAAETRPVPQPTLSGYVGPPSPPSPRYALASQRREQSEQRSRPVIQPSVRGRVSNTKTVFNADAKPFVGSLWGSGSSAAPTKSKEARATGSAGSGHSSLTGKLDCLFCGLYKGVCVARRICLPSVLMCHAAKAMSCCETCFEAGSYFKPCILALRLRSFGRCLMYISASLSSSEHKQCSCTGGQELHRHLDAAATPYMPAGSPSYGTQEDAFGRPRSIGSSPASSQSKLDCCSLLDCSLLDCSLDTGVCVPSLRLASVLMLYVSAKLL